MRTVRGNFHEHGEKPCVVSGECLLCPVGIPTELVDIDGNTLYSGDLVFVRKKETYDLFKQEGREDELWGEDNVHDCIPNVVLAWKTEQHSQLISGRKVSYVDYSLRSWVFGWGVEPGGYKDRVFKKVLDHSEIQEGYSKSNYHYEVLNLESEQLLRQQVSKK